MEKRLHPFAKIPQELLEEIMCRLPLKSVGRFRCASKGWNCLLSSRRFIKSHLSRIPLLPTKLLLVGPRALFKGTSVISDLVQGILVKSDEFDDEGLIGFGAECDKEYFFRFGGSCHGLVLVIGDKKGLHLLNPSTLQKHKLPDLCFDSGPFSRYWKYVFGWKYGFGYDDSKDDYKVVCLPSFDSNLDNPCDVDDTFVDVYSLRADSWTRLRTSKNHLYSDCYRLATASGVLLNGALHWLVSKPSVSLIAAFGLSSQRFEEISVPDPLAKKSVKDYKLLTIEGCLAIVTGENKNFDHFGNDDLMEVFKMKVYGLPSSWTKIVINLGGSHWKSALCHWDDVLFLSADHDDPDLQQFVGYFSKVEKWRELEIGWCEDSEFDDECYANGEFDDYRDEYGHFVDAETFLESLVSPRSNTT